ncbi:diaminopimelate epimerase [Sulfurimonas sp. MAG313]|nr:diaminopimelate epimerase [Sulfurimonas sp. MAG313]MDF1880806.1 diaminopimelate epimerase [Sulfurimonas sp. MAG313]
MQVSKYTANGNDFVIFHTFIKKDFSNLAKKLCHRQEGIGADGLIVIVPHETLDFEWCFYNADGSSAEMCGNGTRACAHYAFNNDLAPAQMRYLTLAGEIACIVDGFRVQSDLTPPQILDEKIIENGKSWWLINTGVPHLVTFDADTSNFDLKEAQELRYKYNCNVNIASIEDGYIKVRTYERGVEDETLACGTGMAACFYRAYQEKQIGEQSMVKPTSNDELFLGIKNGIITFTGDVREVFRTTIL